MADTPAVAPAVAPTDQQIRAQKLLDKLWNDKSSTGQAVRKAAKELFPDITIPDEATELATAPIRAEVDTMKNQLKEALDKIAAREKADSDLRMENDLAVKINSAVAEYGLTDAGKVKMLDRMKETGNVADPSAAAAYVVSKMPKPEPVNTPSWLPQEANLFGSATKEEKWESLHKNPIKYFDDELRLFVKDPDAYVRGDI